MNGTTMKEYLNSDGRLGCQVECFDNGNPSKVIMYHYAANTGAVSKAEYLYDEDNNVVGIIRYDTNGNIAWANEYDVNGNLLCEAQPVIDDAPHLGPA
jgi:hypothetical protein